ncbi:multi-sensor signal transduction histidine kinase [Rhodopseudomonas thermotolerans]|uniref:histidine kinase n=2 Tax=Rhodopseudomonas TaxID=1073 RepID=A0A336K0G5_9BRAD|nr:MULTISPECIES: CHASE3 domain-containing protein [Rhodopseudomonas]RED23008.1 multi-sensor signal transduction histidine kinase [Rhodopseudomonas pentothenatexigens]REF90144.1 multi-sensor signal transduction histidine kinase [Rhodopseudomonas thermotolerans]SSW93394.1 multi-sensor signal transduction histidine kinase [Rhodopseudomonas pentothenatexigens]
MTPESARRRSLAQITLLSLSFGVLVAVSLASVYWLQKAREDNAWVAHTLEVQNQIALVQLQLRRAESAERGYVLTGQDDLIDQFEEAASDVLPRLTKLRSFVADNAVQSPLVDMAIASASERLDRFRRVIALSKDGRDQEARQMLRDVGGRRAMNELTDALTKMRVEENRLFAERTTAADRSQALATIITTTGSGLVLVLAGLSIFLVRRSSRARDEAENQLRENNLNLESTVQERTTDLREANEEIQRFAYIVSHDLRSPLVNIMGFTSELEELRSDIFRRIATLSREVAGKQSAANADSDGEPELEPADQQLSEDFTEALGFIKSSIGKMDRLISAILNLTREGRRQFQPVRIDTRELIENIASTVAHQAAEANAQIRIEPLPEIVSDRLALEQIFSNLIDNALKYLKDGVPGDIVIRGRQKLGFAIYEITDNGRGIDPKDHQRIFDLFRRAGTQDRPGQGIGLAHVRALVRRLGGTMSVSSALGEGSTFTITLPAKWTANKNQEQRA